MSTIFLLSHVPIPRFIKRIEIANKKTNTTVIYWNRKNVNETQYTLPQEVHIKRINLKAPQGKPLLRIFPLIFFVIISLLNLIRMKPKTIHVGNIDMLMISVIYKRIFNKNVNIIYEIGDLPNFIINKPSSRFKKVIKKYFIRIEKQLCLNINTLILTSPFFWENYYSEFIPKFKYLLILNVPKSTTFKNFVKKDRNYKELTIGFIGSIRYKEQIKMLIDATNELENVKVIIAGSGRDTEYIKNYIKDKKNVFYMGPYNFEKDAANLYSDIDCIYSVYNTKLNNVRLAYPNKLYEAIICNLPIIVSKDTELANFVSHNNIGFAVDDNDVFELQSLINKIEKNRDILVPVSKSINEIQENYVYEIYEKKIFSLYS